MTYHLPVLLKESVDHLVTKVDGVYVDLTFGGGGHSREILSRLSPEGRLFAFDQDLDAIANNPLHDKRLKLFQSNFRHFPNLLRMENVGKVDGILADLGVSSHQFDEPNRGFAYRLDAALDMRMNKEQAATAATVLNGYTVKDLQALFSNYGEVRNAKTLAERIGQRRQLSPFSTIADFVQAIEPLIKGDRARYLAQVFQALRIEVNEEMQALEEMLRNTVKSLAEGGKLVVISYHSLEDRLVKRFIKFGNAASVHHKDEFGNIARPFKEEVKGVMVPSEDEIKLNSRARSAKMRVAIKVDK
jgi:16S rRNA (cytosine1402-N4)-methyltransferase